METESSSLVLDLGRVPACLLVQHRATGAETTASAVSLTLSFWLKPQGQTKPTVDKEMVLGNLAEKKEWIATRTPRIGLASIVVIARGDRRQYKFNNKSALKEILLHHQGDFLGLKGIILNLSNSVKKWKKRKDETGHLINGMIVKCKRYLKSKDNSLV